MQYEESKNNPFHGLTLRTMRHVECGELRSRRQYQQRARSSRLSELMRPHDQQRKSKQNDFIIAPFSLHPIGGLQLPATAQCPVKLNYR